MVAMMMMSSATFPARLEGMLTGEELRRMREAAGLMRRELADLLGLEVEVVKLAEAGRGG